MNIRGIIRVAQPQANPEPAEGHEPVESAESLASVQKIPHSRVKHSQIPPFHPPSHLPPIRYLFDLVFNFQTEIQTNSG